MSLCSLHTEFLANDSCASQYNQYHTSLAAGPVTESKNASKAVGVTAIMQHCTAMLRDRMTDAASPLTGYTSSLCPFCSLLGGVGLSQSSRGGQ